MARLCLPNSYPPETGKSWQQDCTAHFVTGSRNGFDTKHILVDGKEHQICLNSSEPAQFAFRNSDSRPHPVCTDQIDSDRALYQDYGF